MRTAVGVLILAAHLAALITVMAWAGRNPRVQRYAAWTLVAFLAGAGILAAIEGNTQ